jgi:hypothetical protein
MLYSGLYIAQAGGGVGGGRGDTRGGPSGRPPGDLLEVWCSFVCVCGGEAGRKVESHTDYRALSGRAIHCGCVTAIGEWCTMAVRSRQFGKLYAWWL